NSAAGFVQTSIAKKLRIRQFPKLTFYVDTGMKEGFNMVQKLNALEKEQKSDDREKTPDDAAK
ncbi:MAG TPA: ribosome-binding factor A, partial [Treponema sp.]|nr:ribosome-binding factor A [Treponema sp.]